MDKLRRCLDGLLKNPRSEHAVSLLNQPLQTFYIIVSHLSKVDRVSLAVTCTAAFNALAPEGSNNFRLGHLQRKRLLLRLERDADVGDDLLYCFLCIKLHDFSHIAFTYPNPSPEQQRCRNKDPKHTHGGVRFAPTGSNLQVGYWQARAVMNRHFYGPGRGLSLEEVFPSPNICESIHRSIRSTQSMKAKIIGDSLFLRCTHELTMDPKTKPSLQSFQHDLTQLDLFICNHLSICQSTRTDLRGDARIPVIERFIGTASFKPGPTASGSCFFCPTDFLVTIEDATKSKHEHNWIITVVSYHELGHCRTSRGRPDPIFAQFLTDGDAIKRRNRKKQPLGYIEKKWNEGS